jgi:diguanylate cyclase (GGDEF)-like protein
MRADLRADLRAEARAGCADLVSDGPADGGLGTTVPTGPVVPMLCDVGPQPAAEPSEWPVSDPPWRISDKVTAAGAERQVLLWQCWARYVAAALTLCAAAVQRYGKDATPTWPVLAGVGLVYAGATALVAWQLRRSPAETVSRRLLGLVLAVDLTAAASVVYLTAAVRDYDRLLILGLVAVQVAVVYYGLSFAVWGLVSTLAAYVFGSLFLTPIRLGPPADGWAITTYAVTYLFAGSTLLFALGSFRARMNALRRLCRDVEVGEFGSPLQSTGDRRPDDLTLLGRSVDDMRHRLIELIGTDPLTECLNRRALETRLARECRQARRRGTSLSVLAVDVDHFKSINDTYGHPFGDYVLQTVADIMNETARDTDAVARLGGDEFILVLPDTGRQGATAFAERLRSNVDDHVFGDQRQSLPVTISVGVLVAPSIGELSPAALLAAADRNLYRAKSAGRNRISA